MRIWTSATAYNISGVCNLYLIWSATERFVLDCNAGLQVRFSHHISQHMTSWHDVVTCLLGPYAVAAHALSFCLYRCSFLVSISFNIIALTFWCAVVVVAAAAQHHR